MDLRELIVSSIKDSIVLKGFFQLYFFFLCCPLTVKSFLPSYVCPKVSLIRMHHFSGSLSSLKKKGILINELSMRIAWTKTHPWNFPERCQTAVALRAADFTRFAHLFASLSHLKNTE